MIPRADQTTSDTQISALSLSIALPKAPETEVIACLSRKLAAVQLHPKPT